MDAIVQWITNINSSINGFVWGPVMLVFLVGTGIYITIRTGFFQVGKFGHVLKNTLGSVFSKKRTSQAGSVTPFQAMTTALAGTVGTGNIVGVATAIVSGGPGAVFWMWVSAFFGMMTKFAEVVLAIHYREKNAKGEWVGGPMYYIKNGLGKRWSWLAILFAAFGALASFGIGNISQINSIASSVETSLVAVGALDAASAGFSVSKLATGIIIAIVVGLVLLGGLKRIGKVTEIFIPFMSVFYILGAVIIVLLNINQLLPALGSIFEGAFRFEAAAGGVLGYTIMQAARYGIARGVFSNEAGLGSAPIAHAAADTDNPVKQGLFGVFEVFVDTLVICTLTALVILCSGVFAGPQAGLDGAALSAAGFSATFGTVGTIFLSVAILFFALSTLLSWSLYGQRCVEYLFGPKLVRVFQVLFLLVIVLGSFMNLKLVWDISDTLNGLMAIPNLIALVGLSGVVFKLTKEYRQGLKLHKTK